MGASERLGFSAQAKPLGTTRQRGEQSEAVAQVGLATLQKFLQESGDAAAQAVWNAQQAADWQPQDVTNPWAFIRRAAAAVG
jgi:hypothetical protein